MFCTRCAICAKVLRAESQAISVEVRGQRRCCLRPSLSAVLARVERTWCFSLVARLTWTGSAHRPRLLCKLGVRRSSDSTLAGETRCNGVSFLPQIRRREAEDRDPRSLPAATARISTVYASAPEFFSGARIGSKSQPDAGSLPALECGRRFETGQPRFQTRFHRMVAFHRVLDSVPELSKKIVGVSEFRLCSTISLIIS